jgi:hypothetical protein
MQLKLLLVLIVPVVCFCQSSHISLPAHKIDTTHVAFGGYISAGTNVSITGSWPYQHKLKYDTSLFQIKNDSLVLKENGQAEYGIIHYRMFEKQLTSSEENESLKAWIEVIIGIVIGVVGATVFLNVGKK